MRQPFKIFNNCQIIAAKIEILQMRKVSKLMWNWPTEFGPREIKVFLVTERSDELRDMAMIKIIVTEIQIGQIWQLK